MQEKDGSINSPFRRSVGVTILGSALLLYSCVLFYFAAISFFVNRGYLKPQMYGFAITNWLPALVLFSSSVYLISSIGIINIRNFYRLTAVFLSIFLSFPLIFFSIIVKYPGLLFYPSEPFRTIVGIVMAITPPLSPAFFFLIFLLLPKVKNKFLKSQNIKLEISKGIFSIGRVFIFMLLFLFLMDYYIYQNSIFNKPYLYLKEQKPINFGTYTIYFEKIEKNKPEGIEIVNRSLCSQEIIFKAKEGEFVIIPHNPKIELTLHDVAEEITNCSKVGDGKCRNKFNKVSIAIYSFEYERKERCW